MKPITLNNADVGYFFISHQGKLYLPNGEIPFGTANQFNLTNKSAQKLDKLNEQNAWLICEDRKHDMANIRSLLSVETESTFLMAGKAVQLAEFYRTHQFCGYCGHTMHKSETEWCCLCDNCNQRYYPQISPSIIVAIQRDDKILLAKHRRHQQDDLYTVLAGFTEVGETIENTVKREVFEETHIHIKNIRYVGSQWLWFLSQPLFHLLKFIQSIVINWGLSIIVITFIIRGVLFPLTRAQYRSMARMKLLQPRIQALKERYGEDRQKLSQETMALYKQEKVNPLGGCLPLIIQMPIFLSLFYMLSNSIELRQAPFILWIQDLAAPDPYYILPLIMGFTMFLIQKMSPTPVTDPLQQKLMTFMPLIFTVFFLWFPSGLVLYYAVSNLFTLAQQRIIYWELEKKGLHESKSKKKK